MGWHFLWCPHDDCNRFTISFQTAEEDAVTLEHHKADCDGLRRERELGATEARMRIDGRWERVVRRLAAKHR